jgi:hypothetical protein
MFKEPNLPDLHGKIQSRLAIPERLFGLPTRGDNFVLGLLRRFCDLPNL